VLSRIGWNLTMFIVMNTNKLQIRRSWFLCFNGVVFHLRHFMLFIRGFGDWWFAFSLNIDNYVNFVCGIWGYSWLYQAILHCIHPFFFYHYIPQLSIHLLGAVSQRWESMRDRLLKLPLYYSYSQHHLQFSSFSFYKISTDITRPCTDITLPCYLYNMFD